MPSLCAVDIAGIALVPSPTIAVDPETDTILAANPGACRLFGVHLLAGRRLTEFTPESIQDLIVFADAVAHRGEYWTRDLRCRDVDGADLAVEVTGRLARTETGAVLVLGFIDLQEMEHRADLVAATRIHRGGLLEWQHAQSFFSDLERQNQLILNAAGEGIYGLNADGKVTFLNRAAEEMLGWTKADLLGQDMHSMIHHHHLSGEVYPSQCCPIYKSFRFEQVARVEDEVFWRKDGRPIRVEYTSTPIYDNRVLAGAVILFRDITERWESERRLREAMAEVAALRDRLEAENAYLTEEITSARAHEKILGASPDIKRLTKQIDLVANIDATVLITGESGSGKSLVAAEIHRSSARHRRPLIRFNCGAVPADTLDDELFGHARGAAPGISRDRAGKLELAHGGTLYLQDVTALPVDVQGRLLRVLEDRAVTRRGEDRAREIDIRLIAATAADMGREIAAGRLREDFYFHLNVFPIACPPLRDRPEDIPPIAVNHLGTVCRRLGRAAPVITRGAMAELQAYHWPGNVRELENVIERAAIITTGEKLQIDLRGVPHLTPSAQAGPTTVLTDAEMRALDRQNLVACLRATGGTVAGARGAAAMLGLKPTTVYSRIKALRIEPSDWSA